LVTALALVSAVLACILVLNWVQHRGMPVVGAWTLCFSLCAAAAVLVAVRGRAPTLLTLDSANTLRLLAFGLCWQTTRYFSGQKGSWTIAIAPSVLWLAGSLVLFGDDFRPRVLVGTPLVAAYSLAIAGELWRVRTRVPLARAAVAVLILHGGVVLGRFAAAVSQTESGVAESFAYPLHPVVLAETIIVAMTLAFLLLAGARDYVTTLYRQAALLDPLTQVSNRRGFEAEVRRILARACRDGTSTALLLLDIDHFKTVNDRWGHLAGDHALQAFTAAVAGELRGGDLLGRFGGEEFAVALTDCRTDQALDLANRIRRAVAALTVRAGSAEVRLTVSIGVASQRGVDSLDALLKEADAALYRAKAAGRDRVEPAPGREPVSARPALVA
jgi:diguanylate cyclase (GGDEF)-like protein